MSVSFRSWVETPNPISFNFSEENPRIVSNNTYDNIHPSDDGRHRIRQEMIAQLQSDFDGDYLSNISTESVLSKKHLGTWYNRETQVKLRAQNHVRVKVKLVKEGSSIYLDISLVLTNGQLINQQRVTIDQSQFEKYDE